MRRRAFFWCLLGAFLSCPVSAQLDFEPGPTLPAGRYPIQVLAKDLDLDGNVDVSILNAFDHSVSLYSGKGDRTFQLAQVVQVDDGAPDVVLIGDFQEDQVLDLAIVCHRANGGALHVYTQNLSGEFTLLSTADLPHRPSDAVSLDLTNDGHLDIAIADATTNKVSILTGDGAGIFSLIRTLYVGSSSTGTILGGDYDRDGNLDLAVPLKQTGKIEVFSGDGMGGFQARRRYTVSANPNSIIQGDWNRDGFLDLAVTHGVFNDLAEILLGSATGFTQGQVLQGINGRAILAESFLPNSPLSLALMDTSGDRVVILEGDGHGSFTPGQSIPVPEQPRSFDVADFDHDGLPDIAVSDSGDDSAFILFQRLDTISTRRGTVNAGLGSITDVLFLNGSQGIGAERIVEYIVTDRFELRMIRPHAVNAPAIAPFAVYAWPGEQTHDTALSLPRGIGFSSMPMPLTGGAPQPIVIWNNARRLPSLGLPTHASSGAPEVFFGRPNGLARPATFFIQGIVFDPGSAAEVPASVTNGILARPVLMR